ncbi:MAG: DUF3185 family protein [Gammaproteobacteria bacterium]
MQTNKIIGLILLLGGVGLGFWGWEMSETFGAAVSSRLSGGMPDEVMYRYIGGGLLSVIGILLVMKN